MWAGRSLDGLAWRGTGRKRAVRLETRRCEGKSEPNPSRCACAVAPATVKRPSSLTRSREGSPRPNVPAPSPWHRRQQYRSSRHPGQAGIRRLSPRFPARSWNATRLYPPYMETLARLIRSSREKVREVLMEWPTSALTRGHVKDGRHTCKSRARFGRACIDARVSAYELGRDAGLFCAPPAFAAGFGVRGLAPAFVPGRTSGWL